MGLFKSEVLSRFPIPRLALASVAVVAPVPPFSIAIIPLTLSAVLECNAKGAVANVSLLIFSKLEQLAVISNSVNNVFSLVFQEIPPKEEA